MRQHRRPRLLPAGCIAVGVNTALPGATVVTSGFYCNGVELTNGAFDQTTFSPQHFALTTGPNGPTTYLNGVATPNQPGIGTIPQIRAVALALPASPMMHRTWLRTTRSTTTQVISHGTAEELTGNADPNHYEAGISGWVGVSASGGYAQALTWARFGTEARWDGMVRRLRAALKAHTCPKRTTIRVPPLRTS